MAIFHFTVTQTKRSKGQSAIASAAYRSGETVQRVLRRVQRLHPKGRRDLLRNSPAVPCTERIRRPSNPLERRGKAERGKTAQLAYSLRFPCRMSFPLRKISLWQGNFCWSIL